MNQSYGQSLGSLGGSAVSYATQTGSYPVDVQYPVQEQYSKFWAIPVVGYTAKLIILIPHLIMLYILHAVVGLLQYVLWIPVLMTGRYPDWGHQIVGGTLSWNTRVTGYLFGLSDTYPAFSLSDPGTGREAQMLFQPSPTSNRLWAIPLVGFIVKAVILIPHMVLLAVLALVVSLAHLVIWFPVMTTGQYPEWGRTLTGGFIRWSTRVYAYWYGLTDAYPPFQLGS